MRLTTVCLLSLALLTHTLFQQETRIDQQKDLRTLIVTVTDKNHAPINKLEAGSFTVTAEKVSQEVVEVTQTDSPLSVVIVFDVSASMGTRQGRASKLTRQALDAVKRFVELSHPANEYLIVGFNEKAVALSDAFQNGDATMSRLDAINSVAFKSGSALFDAVHLAINTLTLGTNARRAVLLISDGSDNRSHATFKETARVLEKTDTLVYPIYIVSDGTAGSAMAEDGQAILKDFASLSGGRFVQPKDGNVELSTIVSQVAAELRGQYLVRIRQAATLKNKCHEFKVKVTITEVSQRKSLNSRVRKLVCDA